MKKILIFLSIIVFSILSPHIHAQEMSSESAEMVSVPTVNYTLPYPGILPDNPLYPLKAMRDRVVSMLIADTVKKSLFNLLQADKRLQSAVYLLYNNDEEHLQLAESTISKGVNYFEQAVTQIEIAKKRDRQVTEEIGRLKLAAAKHQEVLLQLEEKVPASHKKAFELLRQRMTKIQRSISLLEDKPTQL